MKSVRLIKGFTLIEVLVAVAIVAILASVVMFNIQEAKKKSRDTERVSDLQQLQLTLRMYRDSEGSNPTGALTEAQLNTLLSEYLTGEVTDPLSGGDGFAYHYDDAYLCAGDTHTVVYAETMERDANMNHNEVCGGTGSSSYIIIIQ